MQLFRNGVLELAETTFVASRRPCFPIWKDFEGRVVTTIKMFIRTQSKLGITGPFFIFVSLLNVQGFRPWSDRSSDFDRRNLGIEPPNVLASEILLDTDQAEIRASLKPVFDVICNALGLPGSPRDAK